MRPHTVISVRMPLLRPTEGGLLLFTTGCVLLFFGCGQRTSTVRRPQARTTGLPKERVVGPPGAFRKLAESVTFSITPTETRKEAPAGSRTWIATYAAGGRGSQFEIELTLPSAKSSEPMSFAPGAYYRRPKSDPSVLMVDTQASFGSEQVSCQDRYSCQAAV